MAYYAALSSLMDLLEDIMHPDRHPKLLLGRHQLLESLIVKFAHLQELVMDYSSPGDSHADHLESRIRDAANRARDIIEIEISNQLDLEETSREVIEKIFLLLITACQNWVCPCDVKLKKVGQEVDSIVEDIKEVKEMQRRKTMEIKKYSAVDDFGASGQTPAAGSVTVEKTTAVGNTMVGFDEYLNAIKEQLCGHSSQLQVIPIVGMSGIGKTTLARNTLDDAFIVHYFDFRVWVSVSQDYNAKKVLNAILKSMGLVTANDFLVGEEDALKKRIYQNLKGWRYLIVMDDVWGTEVWEDVKHILPDDGNGSRIILTTRLLDVACHVGTSGYLHEIQFLTEDASWSLLRDRVFQQDDCPPKLEDVGKLIASNCRGLPLAIVVIAAILANVKTPEYWREIAKDIATNVSSTLSSNNDSFLDILWLSYDHMPHRLKACFLYMGIFPKGHEINISKLIKLWVAEGFLKSIDGSKSLEKVGEEYLEDLVRRNLVIITKKSANGRFKLCAMHDLLRDLCKRYALYECLFHVKDHAGNFYPKGIVDIHRIVLYSYSPWPFNTSKHVQSILWFGRTATSNFESFELYRFQLLRVLDASETENFFAPYAVSRMFLLKFLALQLDVSRIKRFPLSLSKLQNLQTLILSTPGWLHVSLPSEIWKLPRLRHLIADKMILPEVPIVDDSPLQKLEFLQTLERVKNFTFKSEAIGMIPNLRRLKASYTQTKASDSMWNPYCINNLVHLAQLEELKIIFHTGLFWHAESFPSGFAFPQNLSKLSLQGCQLPWKDLTVVGSLPNLQVLRLREHSFLGEEWEPIEGEFSKLKFLLLESLSLKYWQAEGDHFPCLKHLEIRDCSELREIPLEIGDIPTLEFIEVYQSKRAGVSAKLIQEEQKEMGNDVQVVIHDRWIW